MIVKKGKRFYLKEIRSHQRSDKQVLPCGTIRYVNGKPYTSLRTIGYFFFKEEVLFFQFAGVAFKMTGSKSYQPATKKIDLETKTWIAINTDRNPKKCYLSNDSMYLKAAREVIEMKIQEEIHKMLGGKVEESN